jgi:hypothetical protein
VKTIFIVLGILVILGAAGFGGFYYYTQSRFLRQIEIGDQHYRAGRYQEALDAYQAAHQIKATTATAERIELARQALPAAPAASSGTTATAAPSDVVSARAPLAGKWVWKSDNGTTELDYHSDGTVEGVLRLNEVEDAEAAAQTLLISGTWTIKHHTLRRKVQLSTETGGMLGEATWTAFDIVELTPELHRLEADNGQISVWEKL